MGSVLFEFQIPVFDDESMIPLVRVVVWVQGWSTLDKLFIMIGLIVLTTIIILSVCLSGKWFLRDHDWFPESNT